MSHEIAIAVEHVSKNFVLPHQKVTSIKDIFTHPLQALRGGRTIEAQHALKDVSFQIKKGEFFGIVGRNGSGKSTLLKILAGIYMPSEGSVQVEGKLVPFIELGVGFNPELTGRDNVYLSGALNGFSDSEIDEMYDEIVAFAELEEFMDQKLKNYSSGMQVRLAFSVATRSKADILLIDEVLAVGDTDFQRKCFNYFKHLKRTGKTVVFVSHDMDAVREYCDKALLIDESRVVLIGTSDRVAKEYTRLFLEEEQTFKDSKKWGNGGADISDVTLSKELYHDTDKLIEFSCTLTPDRGIDDYALIGFTIRNEMGQVLCGTNNELLEYATRIHLADARALDIAWSVENVFNSGTYFIDLAVESIQERRIMQWWDQAVSFRVEHQKTTPYLVGPDVKLDVKDS
ncbi:polysaccharide/polyol phosphate ABC transporter ATP-binding protein [Candidatus Saccharibacteria bacterium]|nr:MAG: polysaccharide/polyol phosphate ABC transporter ATP-binding protein [Candidatus Saccharibacteria bacterium]